ncbi:hypothetical protein GCM10023238_33130 [Streptomyces heliomycini]
MHRHGRDHRRARHGPATPTARLGIAARGEDPPRPRDPGGRRPLRAEARKSRGNALAEGIAGPPTTAPTSSTSPSATTPPPRTPNPARDQAIQYALGKGVTVVASAGNGGEKGDHVSYPAAYPGVIAATAVRPLRAPAPVLHPRWYATVSAPAST